jgi:site-specific recombinase XerD
MNTELVPAISVELIIAQLSDSAREYVRHSKATRTLKAYESDLRHFREFSLTSGFHPLPATPETIALYLTSMADRGQKPATMSRRLAAISKAHSAAGYASPASMKNAVVSEVWQGIKRLKGTRQNAKAPATTNYLRQMLEQLPNSLIGIRDRALLLVGFAAALRRSELVALCVEDVQFVPEGLVVSIRHSKTDQEGAGAQIGVHLGRGLSTCPVRSLREWISASGITTGPLFRSINRHGQLGRSITDQVVALQIKKYAVSAGLDHTVFSGHSLRAGCATSAAIAGADERRIMDQTRHRSAAMVRKYIRDGNLFRGNVSGALGL